MHKLVTNIHLLTMVFVADNVPWKQLHTDNIVTDWKQVANTILVFIYQTLAV